MYLQQLRHLIALLQLGCLSHGYISVMSVYQSLAAETAAEQATADKAKHRVTLPCLLLPAQLLAASAQG